MPYLHALFFDQTTVSISLFGSLRLPTNMKPDTYITTYICVFYIPLLTNLRPYNKYYFLCILFCGF